MYFYVHINLQQRNKVEQKTKTNSIYRVDNTFFHLILRCKLQNGIKNKIDKQTVKCM